MPDSFAVGILESAGREGKARAVGENRVSSADISGATVNRIRYAGSTSQQGNDEACLGTSGACGQDVAGVG